MNEEEKFYMQELISKEIEKYSNKFCEIEHQLIQKDIQLATLEFELALQKKFYSLLRESYLNIVHKEFMTSKNN